MCIRDRVGDFQKRLGIKVVLTKVQVRNLLPNDVKTALYRVTQEALTNIERHSKATEVEIQFKNKTKWFEVSIADNGQGFDVNNTRYNVRPDIGIGLRNMDERLSYFKGKLEIKSSDNGTIVIASIPKHYLSHSYQPHVEALG